MLCTCGNPTCKGEHEEVIVPVSIVELEDENGEKEKFAILEKVDFEGRKFAILAPWADVQVIKEAGNDNRDVLIKSTPTGIFEITPDGDEAEIFDPLEDMKLAKRIFDHLDDLKKAKE